MAVPDRLLVVGQSLVVSKPGASKVTRLPDLRLYSVEKRRANSSGVSRKPRRPPVTWIGYLMSTLLCVYLMWMCWYLAREHG
jgi:hypothetical protein